MNRLYTIGQMHGVPIKISLLQIFILVFIVFDTSSYYYAQLYPSFPYAVNLGLGVMTSLALFLSLLIHEYAHCLAAKLCGIGVKHLAMTAFGGVITFHGDFPTPRKELILALVGPWMSFHLSIACFLLSFFFNIEYAMWISDVFYWLGYANAGIALFNLIPGFPTDGGMIINALIWHKTKRESSAIRGTCYSGYSFGAVFMLLGITSLILRDFPLGVFSFLICWVFMVSSREVLGDLKRRESYAIYPLSGILNNEYIPCYADETIAHAAKKVRRGRKDSVVIVLVGSEVVGTLDRKTLRANAHSFAGVSTIMDPIDSVYAGIEYPPQTVCDIMVKNDRTLLPILDGERLLGFVEIDNVRSLFDRECLETYNTLPYSSM